MELPKEIQLQIWRIAIIDANKQVEIHPSEVRITDGIFSNNEQLDILALSGGAMFTKITHLSRAAAEEVGYYSFSRHNLSDNFHASWRSCCLKVLTYHLQQAIRVFPDFAGSFYIVVDTTNVEALFYVLDLAEDFDENTVEVTAMDIRSQWGDNTVNPADRIRFYIGSKTLRKGDRAITIKVSKQKKTAEVALDNNKTKATKLPFDEKGPTDIEKLKTAMNGPRKQYNMTLTELGLRTGIEWISPNMEIIRERWTSKHAGSWNKNNARKTIFRKSHFGG